MLELYICTNVCIVKRRQANMETPAGTWRKLSDMYYRRIDCCNMFWNDVDLDSYLISGAQYGGSIALVRDMSKPVLYNGPESDIVKVDIYNGNGKQLKSCIWDNDLGSIVGFGWSLDERLYVVSSHGTAVCYDLQGNSTLISLGIDISLRVVDVKFHSYGFAAILMQKGSSNVEFLVYSYQFSSTHRVKGSSRSNEISGWTVIQPLQISSPLIYFSCEKSVFISDQSYPEALDQHVEGGPFSQIRISPDGELIALFSEPAKRLIVVSADFQRILTETFFTSDQGNITQIEWLGNDAVVIRWDNNTLEVIGPFDGRIKFEYFEPICLIPEIDGVRILSGFVGEFLQKVPGDLISVFEPNSISSAATLLRGVQLLELKSAKAHDCIQSIRESLAEAVDVCVKASLQEFDVHWQIELMKAASFGKDFLELYNNDEFVESAEVLRVLNQVRSDDIGISLTYSQYEELGIDRLLSRMLSRKLHYPALLVSKFLGVPTENIYIDWASQKVTSSNESDETLFEEITEKFSILISSPYGEISKIAYLAGKPHLARMLLNKETDAARTVPLLLDQNSPEVALEKAIESKNTDMILLVVLVLHQNLSVPKFFQAINSHPFAQKIVELFASLEDKELLKDFYYQDDRRASSANIYITESYNAEDPITKDDKLRLALELYKESPNMAVETKILQDELNFLQIKKKLERNLNITLTSDTISGTIFQLTTTRNHHEAMQLKSKFRISDKTFWWIKLRALAECRDWAEMEALANAKKSPIGYEPFVDQCIKVGAIQQASKYIHRCADTDYLTRLKSRSASDVLVSEITSTLKERLRKRI